MHSVFDQRVDAVPPSRQLRREARVAARPGSGRCVVALMPAAPGRSSSREIASTMKEITNRMKPSASSDESLRLPAGLSGNSSATMRGDGVAGAEQAGGDAVGVADDERHRHGFAQRAAEAQHDAADDRDAGIGDDDRAHHLPGRAADAVGRFLVDRRHRQEHVAHGGGDERDDHHRQDQRRGEDAGAERRPLEQRADHRQVAERVDHERLRRIAP